MTSTNTIISTFNTAIHTISLTVIKTLQHFKKKTMSAFSNVVAPKAFEKPISNKLELDQSDSNRKCVNSMEFIEEFQQIVKSAGVKHFVDIILDTLKPGANATANPTYVEKKVPESIAGCKLEDYVDCETTPNPEWGGLARNKPDDFDEKFEAIARANDIKKKECFDMYAKLSSLLSDKRKEVEQENRMNETKLALNSLFCTYLHTCCSTIFNKELASNSPEALDAFENSNPVKYWALIKELAISNKSESNRKNLLSSLRSLAEGMKKPDNLSTSDWAISMKQDMEIVFDALSPFSFSVH